MKTISILIILLTSLSAFAQSNVITDETTLNVEGQERGGEAATECRFHASVEVPGKVKIRINSDDNAWVFFGFELPQDNLPLKEGYKFNSKKSGEKITYKNGTLKYISNERDNRFTTSTEVIELELSADLKVIRKVEAVEYTKRFGFKKVAKKLSCLF